MRALWASAFLAMSLPTQAQTLRIGAAAETNGADPHNFAMTPNSTLRDNIFQSLTDTDAQGRVRPGLAATWSRTTDLDWHFKLRPGVRFSDGALFGAPDVVATYCRILNNKEELVSSFSHTILRLAAVEPEGEDGPPHPHPGAPSPSCPSTSPPSPSCRAASPRPTSASTPPRPAAAAVPGPQMADFNAGRAAIGTGPYRLAAYTRGGTITLERNPHHAPPAPWAAVRIAPIPQPAARLASLLAGDQDLIEAPGTADLPRLRAEARFPLTAVPTWRLLFIQLDQRDPTPFIQGRNPLRDPRIRQALSLSINRQALADRIMDGTAVPAAQFLPGDMPGNLPGRQALPYDPARARALLAEAGFPQGFAMTLHGTNNRYVNDGPLLQAIAQQFQRVGVIAAVEAMPGVSFFPRRAKKEFTAMMGGWSTSLPETLGFFRTWISTPDPAQGLGTSNYGAWSDPAFDTAVRAALTTMDDDARAALLRTATARALDQMPVIPIHFESASGPPAPASATRPFRPDHPRHRRDGAQMTPAALAPQLASILHGRVAIPYEDPHSPGQALVLECYRPESHRPDSPVVIVQHGMGRNGDEYRDAWIPAADRHGLLIVAITFPQDAWPGSRPYNDGNVFDEGGALRPREAWSNAIPARVVRLLQDAGITTPAPSLPLGPLRRRPVRPSPHGPAAPRTVRGRGPRQRRLVHLAHPRPRLPARPRRHRPGRRSTGPPARLPHGHLRRRPGHGDPGRQPAETRRRPRPRPPPLRPRPRLPRRRPRRSRPPRRPLPLDPRRRPRHRPRRHAHVRRRRRLLVRRQDAGTRTGPRSQNGAMTSRVDKRSAIHHPQPNPSNT